MNISPFLNSLKNRLNDYKVNNNFTYFDHYETYATEGKKYFKVFAKEIHSDNSSHGKRLVALIDKTTGDIYKPASFAAPAAHTRGNVLSASHGMEAINESGSVYYLR